MNIIESNNGIVLSGIYLVMDILPELLFLPNNALSCGCNFFDASRAYEASEIMLSRVLGRLPENWDAFSSRLRLIHSYGCSI